MTRSPKPTAETPYDRPAGYANHYRDQRFRVGSGPKTHRREMRAIAELLRIVDPQNGPWLDLACGTGRLSALLPQPVVQVDRNLEMLRACQGSDDRVCARALALPFGNKTFRGALCMRLLQHIPGSEERRAILHELARVTDGPILLSYFDAFSLQHGRRVISRMLGKPRSGRGAISARQFADDLRCAGLRAVSSRSLVPWISEQRLVLAREYGVGEAREFLDG